MNKNLKKLIDDYNNMDLTNPIAKINLDANQNANDTWRYMQQTFWAKGNRDAMVYHLKKICDQYLESRLDDLKDSE